MSAATLKREVKKLAEVLPEGDLLVVQRFMEYLRDKGADPFLRALATAPLDDEPETPEEAAAVREAYEDLRAGRVVSHEEVRRQLLGR